MRRVAVVVMALGLIAAACGDDDEAADLSTCEGIADATIVLIQDVIDEITSGMPRGDEIPADDDVAEAIVFFCSDRARMITGETLQVHAGELLR